MLTRIVKMTFKEECIDEFLAYFQTRVERIRSFPGCLKAELLRDEANSRVFFTLSHWTKDEDLQTYRNDPFFRETWAHTKTMFAAPAEAWSLGACY